MGRILQQLKWFWWCRRWWIYWVDEFKIYTHEFI